MNKYTARILAEADIPAEDINNKRINSYNPFLLGSPIPALRVIDTTQKYLVDSNDKATIYMNDELLQKLLHLRNAAKNLLFYILMHLDKQSFQVDLNYSKVSEVYSMNMNTYYASLDELMGIGIITKKKKFAYWINPHMIFKGNRPTSTISEYGEQFVHVVATVKRIKNRL